MINTLKKMLGFGPAKDYKKLMAEKAIIVDVRSTSEYAGGHIKGSVNVPLDKIRTLTAKVKDKNQPIITCCASGMRSASAKNVLQSLGYTSVYNGGGWQGLNSKLKG